MKTADIFVADPEGFRSQNADRPPAHLVRELVQNALDEDGVTKLDVEVSYNGPRSGTTVTVRDNSPAGVRDARLLFTIWMSDKEDSPTKRGRMGRGLKEIVSVADETTIRSCSLDALHFKRFRGGKWERRTRPSLGRPESGTEVIAFCAAWGKKAALDIAAFVRRIRAPERVTLSVVLHSTDEAGTSQPVAPFVAAERYVMDLPTVVYEVVDGERVARDRGRETTVECFTPPPGESAWVYEMGIPVEAADGPVSIDIGQRVILRERRDTLTNAYRGELFAKVLSARIDRVPDAALRDNSTLIASTSNWWMSSEAKQRIARVWTEGKPFAATPVDMSAATGHHVPVVNLRSLPEAIRDIVKETGVNVRTVLDARRGEFCPQLTDLTPGQRRTKQLFEWVAEGIHRPCAVVIRSGEVGTRADFNRNERVLSLYADALEESFFQDPLGAEQLRVLIHELSHWTPREDEHGSGFVSDVDVVGGQIAAFLTLRAEQARTVAEANS